MTYDAEAEARGPADTIARRLMTRAEIARLIAPALLAAHAAGKREGAESMRERIAREAQRRWSGTSFWIREIPLDDGGDQ